jgi:hypothetical protein
VLEGWLHGCTGLAGVERDQLLFVLLLCGVRFGIYHPDVKETQAELRRWLTMKPPLLKSATADLLIDVLTPGLERELRAREGYRVGPSGTREKKTGAPPVSKSALAAGLVVEELVRHSGNPALASKDQALSLAGLLTGREFADESELRRVRGPAGAPGIARLARYLAGEYEWWVVHESLEAGDPAPSPARKSAHRAWRLRHASLSTLLGSVGPESIARKALERLGDAPWEGSVLESGNR